MSATLLSLLEPSRIHVGLRAGSKAEVLSALVDLVSSSESVRDTAELLAAVQAREAVMSTGVGQGIAFPHARTSAVASTVAAFATLEEPVDFDALDGQPVRLVLLIAGTENEQRGHVRLLSRASRVLADSDRRRQLLEAASPEEVRAVLETAEAALV